MTLERLLNWLAGLPIELIVLIGAITLIVLLKAGERDYDYWQ